MRINIKKVALFLKPKAICWKIVQNIEDFLLKFES